MAEGGANPPAVETPDPADSPRRGATSNISTSTSSFEAGQQHDPSLNRLAVDMFTKTEVYLQGELDAVMGEYHLLTEMNRRTQAKYQEMRAVGQETHSAIERLNAQYTELEPYLRQLDAVDRSLAQLESAAIQLDSYSKQLETRCRAMSSR